MRKNVLFLQAVHAQISLHILDISAGYFSSLKSVLGITFISRYFRDSSFEYPHSAERKSLCYHFSDFYCLKHVISLNYSNSERVGGVTWLTLFRDFPYSHYLFLMNAISDKSPLPFLWEK